MGVKNDLRTIADRHGRHGLMSPHTFQRDLDSTLIIHANPHSVSHQGNILALIGLVAVVVMIWGPQRFPEALRIPVGDNFEKAFKAFAHSSPWAYEPFATFLGRSFESLHDTLSSISPAILVAVIVLAVGYFRGPKLAGLTVLLFT
jgi:hypothetical protein